MDATKGVWNFPEPTGEKDVTNFWRYYDYFYINIIGEETEKLRKEIEDSIEGYS